jgi:preprotein translocase subunit SecE
MDRFLLSVKESYNELINKVTWPTWPALLSSTITVLIASAILTLIIFVLDSLSNRGLDTIYTFFETT